MGSAAVVVVVSVVAVAVTCFNSLYNLKRGDWRGSFYFHFSCNFFLYILFIELIISVEI